MRIVAFIFSLSPGGAERVLSMLTATWARNGHGVTLVTYDDTANSFYELSADVELRRLRLAGGSAWQRLKHHLRRIPAFRRLVKDMNPDVVVSFMDRTNVLVLAALVGTRIPVIVSERCDPQDHSPGLVTSLLRRLLYPLASGLVVQNQRQADWFRRANRIVRIIPNPVLTGVPGGDHGERTRTILAAGRLTRQKGFDVLLRAFAGIADAWPDWDLVIYGEGPEREALMALAAKLGVADRFRLPGVTRHLGEEMRGAGIFVLSSRYEGFPNVLLEALATGCPVIGSNCSDAVSQLIQHERNGLLVHPGDESQLRGALDRMMGDAGLRARMSAQAGVSVQPYEVEPIARQWERLFEAAQTTCVE